jgi:hypothetical protein
MPPKEARTPKFPGLRAIFLPAFSVLSNGRLWQNLPDYSYGLAGEFHTTSFEIYGYSLPGLGKGVKGKKCDFYLCLG